jgi:undecaprenyl-diphosphatase
VSVWEAVVLGMLQGATEFLPVSSSGHLVVGQTLLGLEIPGVQFEVTVHVATLVSVLVIYRDRLIRLLRGALGGDREAWKYAGLIALATLPAGVVGVFFLDAIEGLFESPWVPAIAFLVTGAILWSTRRALGRAASKTPTWRAALLIGLAQAFALVPGISRSGTTVAMALWLGVTAEEAAAFSFLMAIPAIGGAGLLQVPDLVSQGLTLSGAAVATGFIVAAFTGILAIKAFVALLERRAFHHFAFYCWTLGALFLLYLFTVG